MTRLYQEGAGRCRAPPSCTILREYRRDDPPKLIDGAASSKIRQPVVREMKNEEDQSIVSLLDTGYRMTTSEGGKSHFERAFESMLSLTRVALRQCDLVGVFAWGPAEAWVPSRRGMAACPPTRTRR